HLVDSVRKRVAKTLREQLSLPRGKDESRDTTIFVAISGGKDSAVLLERIHTILSVRPDVKIVAGCVDEGIDGYRKPSMLRAIELAKSFGVEFISVSYPELNFEEMDEVVVHLPTIQATHSHAKGMSPCSFCGVFRRHALNHLAKISGADVMALGHNLDDMAQSILMNMQKGDLERTLRLAPHTDQPVAGMVPRIVPLKWIPEREVHAYAMHLGLPFFHDECPHAPGALRQRHREFIANLEADVPGSRHGLLHAADAIKALHAKAYPNGGATGEENGRASPPGPCERCGEITSADLCKACEMMDMVREAQ
nr:TIGR00269 family protein [Candidatus Poseidoniales archaeon]